MSRFLRSISAAFASFACITSVVCADNGDFNNDGRDDLVIMAGDESVGGANDCGAVHVIYGKSSGLKVGGNQFWHQDVSGVTGTAQNSDYFGWATAAGDFDGDGRDDLAIGVYEDAGGQANAGAVHVLYGRSNGGLSAGGDQFFTRDSDGVKGEPQEDEVFGHTLAAGDFNGDGFDDLAIGVPNHNVKAVAEVGNVHILYGSSSGLTADGDQIFSQDTPGIRDEGEIADYFGISLAAGDFDGDGHDDLAIGAYTEEVNGQTNAGAVNVIYGSNSGLTDAGDQFWHQDVDGIARGADSSDFFGYALAAGDFDNDGRDDLAIGAFGEAVNGVDDAGGVHVLYGSSGGLTATGDQFFSQNTSGMNNQCDPGDYFGCALAAGDFDGDGRDDLAIGACNETVGGYNYAGAIAVIYGSNRGLTSDGDQFITQNTEGVAGSADGNNTFGVLMTSGDFDGDGRSDLAVAAPGATVGGETNAGFVHVFYGSSSGITTSGDQRWSQDSSGVLDEAEANDYVGFSSPGQP